jgi:hypothetical protein
MLLRHSWLTPLMKPPTISEDEEDEAAAEAGHESAAGAGAETQISGLGAELAASSHPETADKEVAEWVRSAMERKVSGKMARWETPPLHAAPLDQVPGSPLLDREGLKSAPILQQDQSQNRIDGEGKDKKVEAGDKETNIQATADSDTGDAIKVLSPELEEQNVQSMDFAGGIVPDANEKESETQTKEELEEQAPEASTPGLEDGQKEDTEEHG